MNALADFARQKAEMIEKMGADSDFRALSQAWFEAASKYRYSYNFEWFGIPIVQFPQDLVALQEVVWASKPDFIVETGVAHGGSLLFYASMLKSMAIDGPVIGVDVEIRAHNRARLDAHPLRNGITLIEGSSTSQQTIEEVKAALPAGKRGLVVLDSNHTYEHVAQELELYADFVQEDSYLVVLDTIVDDMPKEFSADRPWGPNRGPKRAVTEFLEKNERFVIDQSYNNKLLITVAPDGFLRCTKTK